MDLETESRCPPSFFIVSPMSTLQSSFMGPKCATGVKAAPVNADSPLSFVSFRHSQKTLCQLSSKNLFGKLFGKESLGTRWGTSRAKSSEPPLPGLQQLDSSLGPGPPTPAWQGLYALERPLRELSWPRRSQLVPLVGDFQSPPSSGPSAFLPQTNPTTWTVCGQQGRGSTEASFTGGARAGAA